MIKITRGDIELRVQKAGALLKARSPALPIQPDVLLQVADESDLPIGSADLNKDLVARTVFIAGFLPEADEALNLGIDAIFKVFTHGTMAVSASPQ